MKTNINDFNNRFAAKRDQFDKDFETAKKWSIIGAIFTLGLLGFGIWVVIKLLAHFGII